MRLTLKEDTRVLTNTSGLTLVDQQQMLPAGTTIEILQMQTMGYDDTKLLAGSVMTNRGLRWVLCKEAGIPEGTTSAA